MKKVLIAPRKYIQGRAVLNELGSYLKLLGSKPLVFVGLVCHGACRRLRLKRACERRAWKSWRLSSRARQRRRSAGDVGQLANATGADISVGIGGGKVLDVAKAAAVDARIKMVTCPTIASNDSPTSAASVWYDDESQLHRLRLLAVQPGHRAGRHPGDRQRPGPGLRGRHGRCAVHLGRGGGRRQVPGAEHRRRSTDDGRHGDGPAVLRRRCWNTAWTQRGDVEHNVVTPAWRRWSRPTCCSRDWASKAAGWPPPT